MDEQIQDESALIPLSQAAKESALTPEYLNFLSRSGKLKAEKIGRNWLTTRKWIKEFISSNGKEAQGFVSSGVAVKNETKKPYCDTLSVKIDSLEKELEALKREKSQIMGNRALDSKKCPIPYLAIFAFAVSSIFICHYLCVHEASFNKGSFFNETERRGQ